MRVSTHSRPRAAGSEARFLKPFINVSTHSRPRAAGWLGRGSLPACECFNTQPPEGGWAGSQWARVFEQSFNTQPPEGGWTIRTVAVQWIKPVSTHSRPRAAGIRPLPCCKKSMCFNTQPPEGGWVWTCAIAGAFVGFNTQPPEGGWSPLGCVLKLKKPFQHTAARGRLVPNFRRPAAPISVSTHSRPRAAGNNRRKLKTAQ